MATTDAATPGRRLRRQPWVLLRPALSATAMFVVYFVVPLDGGSASTLTVLVLGLVWLVVMLVWQVRSVTRSPTPRLRAIEALATAVPFFLVLFASVYVGLSRSDPASFTESLDRTAALYFTVTVFTTVGFGDIAPIAQAARIVVTIQMVSGLLLLGVVVRVFLGAVQRGLRRHEADDPRDVDEPAAPPAR